MLKKLLLSLAFLVCLTLSVNAETRELWHSDTDEGVLVGWGNPAFALTAEEAAEINIGDTFTITVSGVDPNNGWPQVAIMDVGWPPAANAGVGGKEYPYEASFPMTKELIEKIHKNGISFCGDGAYVSAVSVTPSPIKVSPDAVWFGPKKLNWGDGIGIPASVFADLKVGDKLVTVYDKASESTMLQIILGAWGGESAGPNIGTNQIGNAKDFMTIDGEAGTITIEFIEALSNLSWEEKDYDVFTLVKAAGVQMQGPGIIVNQVLYIPAGSEPDDPEPNNPNAINIEWWHIWDGFGGNAEVSKDDASWRDATHWDDFVGQEIKESKRLLGFAHTDEEKFYANLSNYLGFTGVATPGTKLLMRFNWGGVSTGSYIDHTVVADKDWHFEFSFDDLKDGEEPVDFVHLNFIKVSLPDGAASCKVKSINMIPKPDPLALNADWWHQWDGFGADAQIIPFTKSITDNIGKDLSGDFIIGNGACDGDCYADLTNYAGIEGVATPGTTVRFFFNRDDVQGNGINGRATADADGKYSYLFKDVKDGDNPVSFVHLVFVKLENYADKNNPRVESMKLIPKPDPIVEAKENLQEVIDYAKLYDAYAKTAESFATLQSKIVAAETAKNAEDATVESLAAAGEDITKAIEGLKLEEGYEKLTAEMYMTYPDVKKPGDVQNPGEGSVAGCAYDIFKTTGMPYGDGNVNVNKWADLTGYDKLIITTVGETTPRIMMNREFNQVEKDGEVKIEDGAEADTQADSKMLEMAPGNGRWSTKEYLSSEGNVYTVNLRKIVKGEGDIEGYGFAHLNAIKKNGWGADIFVTGMYLFKSNDELKLAKEDLQSSIDKAENCDKYLKTEESLSALQTAIDEGKAKLEESNPTVESVEAATEKITKAIAGLKLQEGYSELTKDMFKEYASVDNPGEGKNINYNFKLGEFTDQPLGGSKISELEWAELTNYDKLIFKVKEGTLRVLMNRLATGGQAYDNPPRMLDMTVGDAYESTKKYLSTDDNIIYTVDLRKIVDDQDFARLHAVKSNCNITAIYLYKDPKDVEGYNLSFNLDNPANVVIKVNGEEIKDLKAGDNEKTVGDRAKLYIAPVDGFVLKTVKANDEDVTPLMDKDHDGSLTKTIVKNISYTIETEEADVLEKPRIELQAAIENAELYDDVAKTEESFQSLTDAIDAAKPLLTEDTTPEAIADAIKEIQDAINGLVIADDYAYLTSDMFKKYASVTEPGEGEDTDYANETLVDSMLPYGDKQNGYLNWADLSEYDELIVTVHGSLGPRFYMNRLEENGVQAETMEESKMIDIDPRETKSWSYKYLNVDGNKYTVDLKAIVKDHKFARLHSIQPAGYEQTIFITGMYLWKDPTVYVTRVTLDKNEATMTFGDEPLTLVATVVPEDATDKTVEWSSDNEDVATVENGKVTALKVGKATITASCGDFSAKCDVKVYPKVGDANLDGAITITDAVDITNYVVERKVVAEADLEFYLVGANANGEEGITFADASAAAELALDATNSGTSTQTRIRAFEDESADALVIGRAYASTDGTILPVALDNSMAYVALQADIILPEGMNVDVKAGSRIAGSHSLMTRKHADNHIRVVLFNLSNSAFADNDAPILEIVTDSYISASDIMITTVLASDADAKEYVLAAKTSVSTGVAALGLDENDPIKVFDVNGIYVSDTIEGLQQGTYIVCQGDKAKKVRIR